MQCRSDCYGSIAMAMQICDPLGFARNDVLGNVAVLLAALGVFGTGTGWPDVIVAAIMAMLALQGAATVAKQAIGELREPLSMPAM
jgi:divalent metal cation (Fe/Co/Zn/Cd) transporter